MTTVVTFFIGVLLVALGAVFAIVANCGTDADDYDGGKD